MPTIVLGAGAAGFFAAIQCKQTTPEDDVTILEKSSDILSKVRISGGGRCNVTHACFDPKTLIENYPRGGRELLGPFHTFQPKDTMAWFESHSVPLKTEADNRVFPVSDNSESIAACLIDTAKKLGVILRTNCTVTEIRKDETTFHLILAEGSALTCTKLILATGSNRSGYAFAKSLGHTIIDPIPSLFTLTINDKALHSLSGLSVAKTEVWIAGEKKRVQKGPLLITHWGMSGPSIIKLSAWNARPLHEVGYKTTLFVNWLPQFDNNSISTHLQKTKDAHPLKIISKNSPTPEIPGRLWAYLTQKAGIQETQTWKTLTPKQLTSLGEELSQGNYPVTGKGAFKEEFVTCGGVPLKEINFKTMESKCCKGLYIIGELLDIDGVTGGFNFQNAWTTAFIAGQN